MLLGVWPRLNWEWIRVRVWAINSHFIAEMVGDTSKHQKEGCTVPMTGFRNDE